MEIPTPYILTGLGLSEQVRSEAADIDELDPSAGEAI